MDAVGGVVHCARGVCRDGCGDRDAPAEDAPSPRRMRVAGGRDDRARGRADGGEDGGRV